MFQNLRPNSTLYILHKGVNPSLEYGQATYVSGVKTVYKTLPNNPYPQPVQVVDIVVSSPTGTINLKEVPANADMVDDSSSGVLVSASRDNMNTEILTMKQKSEEVLRSVDYHKNFLAACDMMLNTLNPEIAAKQQQEQEIASMKEQIASMTQNMNNLMEMNRQLMEQLGLSSETSSKMKK